MIIPKRRNNILKNLKITVNGVTYDVQVEEVGASSAASAPAAKPAAPVAAPAAAPAPAPKAAAPVAGAEEISSPMPGTILDVKVKAGQSVKSGDVLLVLEAMKMENEIMAPHDATVAAVHVSKGETVESGTLLVSLN